MLGTIIMGIVAMFILHEKQKVERKLEIVKSENYSLKLVMAQEGLIPKEYVK